MKPVQRTSAEALVDSPETASPHADHGRAARALADIAVR